MVSPRASHYSRGCRCSSSKRKGQSRGGGKHNRKQRDNYSHYVLKGNELGKEIEKWWGGN